MSGFKSLLVLSTCLAMSAYGMAGTLSIGYKVIPSGQYGSSVPFCQALANGNRPTDSETLSLGYKVLISYTAQNLSDTPPATVQIAYDAKIYGGWDYALIGSTTTHWSVSGAYSVHASSYGIDLGTLSGDSGPIQQTADTQEGQDSDQEDFSPDQSSITPNWGTPTHNSDGTYTYVYAVLSLNVSGSANATAQGWNPPPPRRPEGRTPYPLTLAGKGRGTSLSFRVRSPVRAALGEAHPLVADPRRATTLFSIGPPSAASSGPSASTARPSPNSK